MQGREGRFGGLSGVRHACTRRRREPRQNRVQKCSEDVKSNHLKKGEGNREHCVSGARGTQERKVPEHEGGTRPRPGENQRTASSSSANHSCHSSRFHDPVSRPRQIEARDWPRHVLGAVSPFRLTMAGWPIRACPATVVEHKLSSIFLCRASSRQHHGRLCDRWLRRQRKREVFGCWA